LMFTINISFLPSKSSKMMSSRKKILLTSTLICGLQPLQFPGMVICYIRFSFQHTLRRWSACYLTRPVLGVRFLL
jgi:hypothetical protein